MSSFYDLTALKPNGEELKMSEFKGKVICVVNTATKCGFTPQLEGLNELYKKYESKGLIILGLPCNQFASQNPEDDKGTEEFCKKNYGVEFQFLKTGDVNGTNTVPLFQWLKKEKSGILGTNGIKWNFTKFLIDKQGKVFQRYSPTTKPSAIEKDIQQLLEA